MKLKSQPNLPMELPPGKWREEHLFLRRHLIAEAVSMAGGNVSKAARMLGVSNPTVKALCDQFGIARKRNGKRGRKN